MEIVLLPYGFSVTGPTSQKRICETTEKHIDCNLTEITLEEENFVFDSFFTTVVL